MLVDLTSEMDIATLDGGSFLCSLSVACAPTRTTDVSTGDDPAGYQVMLTIFKFEVKMNDSLITYPFFARFSILFTPIPHNI